MQARAEREMYDTTPADDQTFLVPSAVLDVYHHSTGSGTGTRVNL
jgi:hypothetical protein